MLTTVFQFLGLVLTRCYGDFGCFSLGGSFQSINRPINVFPMSPDTINVTLHLYNRYNFKVEKIYDHNNFSDLNKTSFCPSCETKIIIHGFTETTLKPWLKTMAWELLKNGDYNVVIVDWRKGAAPPYTQAVANARIMGTILARFIQSLQDNFKISSESIHIIGHSLGAQVASYVGQQVKRLGRITGLDPAKPFFENTPIDVRLDASDANFVDVIHTDTGESSTSFGGSGYFNPIGHIDFYPNGGKTQPGCEMSFIPFMKRTSGTFIYRLKQYMLCNHKLSYLLFIESINSPCPFLAAPCESWENYKSGECFDCTKQGEGNCFSMGLMASASQYRAHNYNVSEPIRLYLMTGRTQPHCRYHYRILIQVTDGYYGKLYFTLAGESVDSWKTLFMAREMQYVSGTNYTFVFGEKDVGKITDIILEWQAVSTLSNPSTWLRWKKSSLVVKQIRVDNLEGGRTVCFDTNGVNFKHNFKYSLQASKPCYQ